MADLAAFHREHKTGGESPVSAEPAEALVMLRQPLHQRRAAADEPDDHTPDGALESEAFVDTDGIDLEKRIRYHVRVEKKGDRIHFDFSESDDQVIGPINIRPALGNATMYFALTVAPASGAHAESAGSISIKSKSSRV